MANGGAPGVSFLTFVNRCQAAIGECGSPHTGELGGIWHALSCPPDITKGGQRLMTLAIVADVLTRLRREKRVTRVPTWVELCALFEDPSSTGVGRRISAFRLLEVHRGRRGRPECPDLARLALRALAQSYRDPAQSLERLAENVHVTAGHLGRILRQRTGHPFRWHLRGIRTRQAAALLHGQLTIKEIAGVVGYPSVSELDRDFRATFGTTPSAYRMVILKRQDFLPEVGSAVRSQLLSQSESLTTRDSDAE
jgi:AraC-like DNA-binding protein